MTAGLRFTRVLVPIDGSDCSRQAADYAIRLAAASGAELIFIHAVDDQMLEQLALHASHDERRRVHEQLRATGQAHLHDVARAADIAHVIHREVVEDGDPCVVICEAAVQHAVDLIVMGKIGRRGARRIVMGSITRRVTEASDRPVLIVAGTPTL